MGLAPEHDPAPAPRGAIDAIELLLAQHRRLETLLEVLVKPAPPEVASGRLKRVGDELAVHMSAEELVFYPAVRAERTEDILLESLEEHLSLKRLLADLLALPVDDATFLPKCKVLREQAEHHHREEEEHLFPKVRNLLTDERRGQLGREMLQQQQRLRQDGPPREVAAAQTDAAESLDPVPPAG